jgi:23S rRNA (cytosine1962-C5)-methyltransferase
MCSEILAPQGFFIINLYSLGFSALITENLIYQHFKTHLKNSNAKFELGELYLTDKFKKKLPLGTFLRF